MTFAVLVAAPEGRRDGRARPLRHPLHKARRSVDSMQRHPTGTNRQPVAKKRPLLPPKQAKRPAPKLQPRPDAQAAPRSALSTRAPAALATCRGPRSAGVQRRRHDNSGRIAETCSYANFGEIVEGTLDVLRSVAPETFRALTRSY
jgi:hypothetical protein